jgi:hypothetical protein
MISSIKEKIPSNPFNLISLLVMNNLKSLLKISLPGSREKESSGDSSSSSLQTPPSSGRQRSNSNSNSNTTSSSSAPASPARTPTSPASSTSSLTTARDRVMCPKCKNCDPAVVTKFDFWAKYGEHVYSCSAEPYSVYGNGSTFCGYTFLGGGFTRRSCQKCGAHQDHVRIDRAYSAGGLHFVCTQCKAIQQLAGS